MLVVSPISTDKITAGKIYTVSDYDTHDGWIVNDLGENVRIVFDDCDDQLDFKEKWFVLQSTKKSLMYNSLADLIQRVYNLERKIFQENLK